MAEPKVTQFLKKFFAKYGPEIKENHNFSINTPNGQKWQ